MMALRDGEKNWEYIYSFLYNTRTLQTDGQTPYDGLGRAIHIVARQKVNENNVSKYVANIRKWRHSPVAKAKKQPRD